MTDARLTTLVPTPRTVVMAGRGVLVRPATIRTLAELQGWLDADERDPFDGIGDALAAGGDAKWAAVRAAIAGFEPAPEWDSPEGDARLWTAEGLAFTIWLGCRPDVGPADAARILSGSSPSEIAAFRRAFFGIDPIHELYRILLGEFSAKPEGRPVSWPEAVHRVAEAMGWTYSQVYDLTLAEFGYAMRGGKPAETPGPSRGVTGNPGRFREYQRRLKG